MVTVLNIIKMVRGKSMRLELLADSTEDKLPTKIADIKGLSGEGVVDKGSTCITPAADFCMVGNNGKWGDWL